MISLQGHVHAKGSGGGSGESGHTFYYLVVFLLLLLILSGDIELNPGPKTGNRYCYTNVGHCGVSHIIQKLYCISP